MDRYTRDEIEYSEKKERLQDEAEKEIRKIAPKDWEKLCKVLAESSLFGSKIADEYWREMGLNESHAFAVLDEDEELEIYFARDERESRNND